jgi:hypothetical protein
MTPDKDTHYSLLCETSYSEFKHVDGKTIVEDTIQGLINAGLLKDSDRKDIVDTWTYHADYSYPTPSVERDGILAEVIPYLEQHGIYSRGRFGMWKYEVSNTDHTLMQGVEVVNRLLLDEPETTIGMKYASTDDGRNAAVHERSHVAGSGDPKRASAGVPASAGMASKSKDPDQTPALRTPGKQDKLTATVSSAVRELSKPRPGGPGDKDEVHVSEEELGVTQNDGGTK